MTVFLIAAVAAALPFTVAFFFLCGRERRFPTILFMFELVARWSRYPDVRRDPWVSTAVIGYVITSVGMIGHVIIGHVIIGT